MLRFYSFDKTRQRLYLICTHLKVIACYLNFQIETKKLSPPPPKASKKDRTQKKYAPTDKISPMKLSTPPPKASKKDRTQKKCAPSEMRSSMKVTVISSLSSKDCTLIIVYQYIFVIWLIRGPRQ